MHSMQKVIEMCLPVPRYLLEISLSYKKETSPGQLVTQPGVAVVRPTTLTAFSQESLWRTMPVKRHASVAT